MSSQSATQPTTIYLKDYTPPAFLIDTVDMLVDVYADHTLVTTRLALRRNPVHPNPQAALQLDGEELETLAVRLDGRALLPEISDATDTLPDGDHFHLNGTGDAATRLTLAGLPAECVLETLVKIYPDKNTQLSGLYRSKDGYFTQCEAEGFRRITWFQDRPDVMSTYTVTLSGDKEQFPLLLSNGNPVERGDGKNGRHWVRWEDPFRKPCYLFALVAAKLDGLHDTFTTRSGREVQLAVYVEPGKLDQADHAMAALKKSMRWDEDTFGLECDLDHYMIVAVGDFNMGAMENKGLNIFNTKYVLARPDTATDVDYANIDSVVAHEYFHNWTGNRVTCREWFQLSLKEGLTVFRDQEFSADLTSRAVSRIQDVRTLRAAQFPEDAGPMAHPVRPSSYMEINNFYTATVYEKGSEVVRMMHTLLGKEAFRRGMDVYFARHDGQAVTCDDFAAAMMDASGIDLSQFKHWYAYPGTPKLAASGHYDAQAYTYTLSLRQQGTTAPGIDADSLPAFHIPLSLGLLSATGEEFPLVLAGEETANTATSRVLSMTEKVQEFVFTGITSAPVPSLLRNFSAPVVLEFAYTDAELALLLAHDSDAFNRWEAGQRLASRLILGAAATLDERQVTADNVAIDWAQSFAPQFAAALADLLANAASDPAFVAEVLTLPTEATLAEQMAQVHPAALHCARLSLRRYLASQLQASLLANYQALAIAGDYRPTPEDAGKRALRNLCLGYLSELQSQQDEMLALAEQQFRDANNMTDQFAALAVLAQFDTPRSAAVLEAFYQQWQHEALVVDKWLSVQATSRKASTLATVTGLLTHPAFDLRNPNKVYALLGGFGTNHALFHAADGSGYQFLAARIRELDSLNPQVAARLTRRFDRWRNFPAEQQAHARTALTSLHQHAGLSRGVFEIVERSLG